MRNTNKTMKLTGLLLTLVMVLAAIFALSLTASASSDVCEHVYDDNCDAECNECGEFRFEVPHGELTYNAAVVPANCLEQGHNEYWVCSDCGAYFGDAEASYEINPAWMYYSGEHVRPDGAIECATVPCELCGEDTYGEADCVSDSPKCTDGECINCGGPVYGEGHSYGYDEETWEPLSPFCLPGTCIHCNEELEYIYEHENGSWAPCSEPGYCAHGCGLEYAPTGEHAVDPCTGGTCWMCWTEIAATHVYDNDCDAECNECGEIRDAGHEYFYPCDPVCMKCYEITNPDATHNIVAVEAKAATCTEMGNIAYWYCSDCGSCWADEALTQVTNRMSVVVPTIEHEYFYPCDPVCMHCYEITNPDATHNVVAVEAKAATCAELGNIAYWYCSDCGSCWADEAMTQITNRMNVIVPMVEHEYFYPCDAHCMNCAELTNPNAAHTISAVEAKAATCTELGNIAYWCCSDCGSCWADEALTQVTNRMSVIVPMVDHDMSDATCTAPATCSVCGATEGEALGHTWVDATTEAPKTCTTCGATEGDALPETPATTNPPATEPSDDDKKEEGGCFGAISLAALAVVPALAVAFVAKKKED